MSIFEPTEVPPEAAAPEAAAPEAAAQSADAQNQAASMPPVIDHAPEAQAPEPPAKAAFSAGTPWPVTILLVLALAGAGYWGWAHPKFMADPQPAIEEAVNAASTRTDATIAALAARVDALEKQAAATQPVNSADLATKLGALSDQLAALDSRQTAQAADLQKLADLEAQKPAEPAAPTPAPDNAAQSAAIAQLQQQLSDLSGKLDQSQAQAKTTLATLDQRVGTLEQGAGQIQGAAKDAARAIRLQAAQAALAAGQPLGDLPGAPPALARFATTPPPTDAALRSAYPALARKALAVSKPDLAGESFWQRALSRMEASVTVRRGDHVIVGDPAAGILARAQTALDNDDLPGAVADLGALSGPPAAVLKPWVDQVQALLAARAALARLAAGG